MSILLPAVRTAVTVKQQIPVCTQALFSQKSQTLCSKPKHGQGGLKEVVAQQQTLQSCLLVRMLTVQHVVSSVCSAAAKPVRGAKWTPHILMLLGGFKQDDSPSDVIPHGLGSNPFKLHGCKHSNRLLLTPNRAPVGTVGVSCKQDSPRQGEPFVGLVVSWKATLHPLRQQRGKHLLNKGCLVPWMKRSGYWHWKQQSAEPRPFPCACRSRIKQGLYADQCSPPLTTKEHKRQS